jgi:integrase
MGPAYRGFLEGGPPVEKTMDLCLYYKFINYFTTMQERTSTHTVVHLGIAAADAQTLPVLVELDCPERPTISVSVAQFTRYLQREGLCSYETLRKTVAAIGKLRDYYYLVEKAKPVEPGGASSMRFLLEDFLHALDIGSEELGWSPASVMEYTQARTAVVAYVKWLIDTSTIPWLSNEVAFIEHCRQSYIAVSHAHKSLLFHTKKRARKKSRGRKKQISGLWLYRPFPPHLVAPLIDETSNARDKLLFAMLAYGGRRISEIIQLFTSDVTVVDQRLSVKLRHPALSPMTWVNKAGSQLSGSRREYLRAEFGLLPRTEHGALPTAAGWKGIKFDDEAKLESHVYWIRSIETYLADLHRHYLHEIRAAVPRRNHPYYFTGVKGQVLTLGAVERQFELACKRLEKRYGVSLKGYGPHSLRHYYGFYCADVLRVDLLLIQKYMGHSQVSSTAIYAHITPETAAAELQAAEESAEAQRAGRLPKEERLAISRAYVEKAATVLPSWREHGATAFGTVDTKRLKRGLT